MNYSKLRIEYVHGEINARIYLDDVLQTHWKEATLKLDSEEVPLLTIAAFSRKALKQEDSQEAYIEKMGMMKVGDSMPCEKWVAESEPKTFSVPFALDGRKAVTLEDMQLRSLEDIQNGSSREGIRYERRTFEVHEGILTRTA